MVLLPRGVAQLLRQPQNMEGLRLLGYPAYVATILGSWKVLGAACLLLPGLPRLREWAYAGTVFLLTGAAASHALSADYGRYGFNLWVPLGLAGLTLVSRALRASAPPVRAT